MNINFAIFLLNEKRKGTIKRKFPSELIRNVLIAYKFIRYIRLIKTILREKSRRQRRASVSRCRRCTYLTRTGKNFELASFITFHS